MKSAFLISEGPGLFVEIRDALMRTGSASLNDDGYFVQFNDGQGRLLSVVGHDTPETEWEFRDGPFVLRNNASLPDMQSISACLVECRWEDLFASVAARLAGELQRPLWALDSDGSLWPATAVDPDRIIL